MDYLEIEGSVVENEVEGEEECVVDSREDSCVGCDIQTRIGCGEDIQRCRM